MFDFLISTTVTTITIVFQQNFLQRFSVTVHTEGIFYNIEI